jgi:hypothetical protein
VIDQGLVSLILQNPGFSRITGQLFRGSAPDDQKFYPCGTYAFVGGSAQPTINTSGVIRQRVELNGLSFNADQAAVLRDAMIAAVNGWQQRLPNGANVLNTILLNPGTDFVTGDRIFRCMCEFYILYTLPSAA